MGQERRVDAQGRREEEGGEKQEGVNSLHDECHVWNRHMTWWQNAWWIRVDNGPHMCSARGRRRAWRAARRAAEQVRDGNWVEETKNLAEEAVGKKGKGERAKDRQDRAVRTLCTPFFTCRNGNSSNNNSRNSSCNSSHSNSSCSRSSADTAVAPLQGRR